MRLIRPTGWHWFPWAVAGAMTIVVIVNGFMVYSAISTFPGRTARGGFDLSNHYNGVLARAEEQAKLGWVVKTSLDGMARPVLALTDASGAALSGARIEGFAERPIGDPRTITLGFNDKGAGRYQADLKLDEPGQWDVTARIRVGEHAIDVTRRVVVP